MPVGSGPGLELRRHRIGAHGFEHEVGAAAAEQTAGVAAAEPQTIVGALGEIAHVVHEAIALDVGIEDVGRADLQRQLAARADRIDGDDSRGARDPRALNAAQPQRTASDDGDGAPGIDERGIARRRAAEAGDGDAAADHAELDGRSLWSQTAPPIPRT